MTNITRICTEDDIESVIQLDSYAYGIPESSIERFRENLKKIYTELYIHLSDDIPTAAARVLPFKQNIRGLMKPMAGIGMVSSAPEYRRQGFVRDMMLKILEDLNSGGFATTTLYPFKDMFYGALGYAKMPPTQTLEVNPKHFEYIVKPHGYTAKREEGELAVAAWKKLHQHVAHETHGAVERSENRWQEKTSNIKSKIVIARNPQGDPEGFMLHSIKGYSEGHSWAETGEMTIIELLWSTLEGRDTLFSYLYGHADQVVKVKMVVSPRTSDYYHWISNIHTPKTTGNIVSMARIINVEESLKEMPAIHDGETLVEVTDANCEWNNGTYKIQQSQGNLIVEKVEEPSSTTITIDGITSLLYGTLDLNQLKRLGWLRGDLPSELVHWFPKATPWLTEDF